MANSEIDVCAQALLLLGLPPIASFDDGSDKALICANLHETVIDGLLRSYPWRFAMRKAALNRLAQTPKNQWKHGFQLPSDRLGGPRAVFAADAVSAPPIAEFEIFGDKLFANETSIWIDYPFKPLVRAWPPHFTQLAVYACAAMFADALTEENKKAERWHRIAFGTPAEGTAGGYLRTAKAIDAAENPPEVFRDYPLVAARY